jgi:primosomal protein N' (replication factor Y)
LAEPIKPGSRRVQVLLPLPLASAYDYRVPEDVDIEPGAFVSVPFGNRDAVGVVWAEGGSGAVGDNRLKDVNERLAARALPESVRRFVDWVATYTLSTRGAVLRMAMSVPAALEAPRPRVAYALAQPQPDFRETPARRRVLALLADGPPRPASELAREAGVGTGVVTGLATAGVLERVPLRESPPPKPDPERPGPDLSAAQAAAAESLVEAVRSNAYDVALLDGVTGSGKTEVYFEAIAETLRQGRQALVLLPEISLTADWLERFTARFGVAPVQWHSDLTQSQRRWAWRSVAAGEAPVVVGARSALFLPFPRLGLVVVDEEHDPSYKQQDGVAYNARDMAVVRASIEGCPAVLASATPSLETVVNVERGRYRRLALPERHARRLDFAAAARRAAGNHRTRRAGAAVPEPARLRAADLVPRLRVPFRLSQLHRMAGVASAGAAARMSPLRLYRPRSGRVSAMRRRGVACRLRAGGRAARRGSGRTAPRGPAGDDHER